MLDISYLSDDKGEHPSFLIMDGELKLFVEAFEGLRAATGVYIDPYGKSRIYPEHQNILASLLIKNQSKKVDDFVLYLSVASQAGEVLLADGD